MAPRKRLGELLIEAGVIDDAQLQAALGHQRQWGGRIGQVLVDMKFLRESAVVEVLARRTGHPIARLSTLDPRAIVEAIPLIPRELADRHNVLPIAADPSAITVAMADPTNLAVIDELRFRTNRRVKVLIAGDREIAEARQRAYAPDAHPVQPIALDLEPSIEPLPLLDDPFGGLGSPQGGDSLRAALVPTQHAPAGGPVGAPVRPASAAAGGARPARTATPPPVLARDATEPPRASAPAAPRPRPAVAPAEAPWLAPPAPIPAAPASPAPVRPGVEPPTSRPAAAPPPAVAPAPAPDPGAARSAALEEASGARAPLPGAFSRGGFATTEPAAVPAPAPAVPSRAAPAPAVPSRAAAAPAPAPTPAPVARAPVHAPASSPSPVARAPATPPPAIPAALATPPPLLPAEEEMVEGRPVLRALSAREVVILDAIERLAAGRDDVPLPVKPSQVAAALIRILLARKLVTEQELLDALLGTPAP